MGVHDTRHVHGSAEAAFAALPVGGWQAQVSVQRADANLGHLASLRAANYLIPELWLRSQEVAVPPVGGHD